MQEQLSETQFNSEKSFKDLGLMLTEKILTTKMKLKEINPTLIYEWDGQTLNNLPHGKGIFRVRQSLTNQMVFECQVSKWKAGVPQGKIKTRKIHLFPLSELADSKVKEIQTYEGESLHLRKHGKGTYTFQEFFSSGRVKKTIITGQWRDDILISGTVENQHGTKDLNLNRNIEWSKSSKSIMLEQERFQEKEKKQQVSDRLFKESQALNIPKKGPQYLDVSRYNS